MKTFDKLLTLFNEVGKDVPLAGSFWIFDGGKIHIGMSLDQKTARVEVYGKSGRDLLAGNSFFVNFDRETDDPVSVELIQRSGFIKNESLAIWTTENGNIVLPLGYMARADINQAYQYYQKQKKKGALKPTVG